MSVQISKTNLLDVLGKIPKKFAKVIVASIEGDNFAIIGRGYSESKSLFHLYTPLVKSGKLETLAIDYIKLASKVNSIRDDIITLSFKDGLLTVTGKEAKERSYKLTTLDVENCPSYIDYQSDNKLIVSAEKGKLVKVFPNDPSRNETILFNREIPLSGKIKEDIINEIPEVKGSLVYIEFKPNISTFYAEDGETNTFTRIDIPIPIDFSFSYIADPVGFKAVLKLFKDDSSLLLSDERPAMVQFYGQGNSIILGSPKKSESIEEFISRCKSEE